MSSQVAFLPTGRQIGYSIVGGGRPVVYFHGTASSRLEVFLLKKLAETSNLQIIGIDRPGYGLSSFRERRNLQDFNADVNFLLDHLGFENFGVLGWSGGGAFALSYLAFFSERVTKTVVVSAPSLPFDASTAHNMPFARYIMEVPFIGQIAMRRMRSQVLRAYGDIDAFLTSKQGKLMLNSCSRSDLRFFSDPSWMRLMYQSMAESFRQGTTGVKAVLEEHKLFLKPWSFSIARVPADKLLIWHGAEDKTCLVSNAQSIFRSFEGSHLEIFQKKGHCIMFDNLKKLGDIFLDN